MLNICNRNIFFMSSGCVGLLIVASLTLYMTQRFLCVGINNAELMDLGFS